MSIILGLFISILISIVNAKINFVAMAIVWPIAAMVMYAVLD